MFKIGRWFANGASVVKGVIGGIVTAMVIIVLGTEVLPELVNETDGGLGQAVYPILYSAIFVAAVLAAVGVIYVAVKGTLGGK